MNLMSCHATILCAAPDGTLYQGRLSDRSADAVRYDASANRLESHAPIGIYELHVADEGVCLKRNGLYVAAENDKSTIQEDRHAVGLWETFYPVSPEALGILESAYKSPEEEMERFAARVSDLMDKGEPIRLHFGAGHAPIPGFLNIDIEMMSPAFARKLPNDYFIFPYVGNRISINDGVVDYIFHEDFIEHIDQIGQIQFLAETFRILKPGAYHRVNTPNLIHSMATNSDFSHGAEGVYTGELQWGHIALFSKASLEEISKMIGYASVIFTAKGDCTSPYGVPDRRPHGDRDEIDGNIYADLRK